MRGNLINLRDRSPEERKKIARMGGVAAARERKRKKELITWLIEGGCENGSTKDNKKANMH